MAFTDAKIRNLKVSAERVAVWEDGSTCMGVRAGQKGKVFIFKYRYDGQQRILTVGNYPKISLADARQIVAGARKKLEKGIDPQEEKSKAKKAYKDAETMVELAEEYLEKYAKPNKSPQCAKEDKRILDVDVLPVIGRMKAKEVARRDLIKLLDGIVERGAPIQANRTLACISKMFNFAVRRDILPASPCVGIEKPAKENKRDRVLNETEIKSFWKKLEIAKMDIRIKLALKLQLLTAQRKGEIVSSEWSEIDFHAKVWEIPSEKAKNRIPHRVPLSAEALRLLKEVRALSKDSKWLFKSEHRTVKKLDKPMTPGAIDTAVKKNQNVFKIKPFTPHDLRRTAASHMTSIGIPRLVVSRILNHSEGGITSVYDRYSYDKEKREALKAWALKLKSITTAKKLKLSSSS